MRLVFLLLMFASVRGAYAQEQHASSEQLISASSSDHLWLIYPGDASGAPGAPAGSDERLRLMHHARAMQGPYFTRGPALSRVPEAIAAYGDRVWLVFPPEEANGRMRREVFTIRMVRDPAIGLYQPVPASRLALGEALPGWGDLVGLSAGDAGPVALIVPLDHETFHVHRDGKPTQTELKSPQLLQLRTDGWAQLDLPANVHLSHGEPVALAFAGPDVLFMLTGSPATGTLIHQRAADGTWTSRRANLAAEHVRALTSAAGRLAAVTKDDQDNAAVSYVRGEQLLALANFAAPTRPWTVQGIGSNFQLITLTADGQLSMQEIDGITGEMSEPAVMSDQPLPTAKLWHTGLMLAVSVIAVLIVLLVRPNARGAIRLPPDATIVPPLPRLAALLIDLVPGAAIAMIVMGASIADLLRLPMMAESLEQVGPHLVMLAVTFLHCTIVELIAETTLGKLIVGASVNSANGDRPTALQVLIRNGVKLMVLIVPPLAVFALLNPYMQGFNDMAARTIVLRRTDPDDEDEE